MACLGLSVNARHLFAHRPGLFRRGGDRHRNRMFGTRLHRRDEGENLRPDEAGRDEKIGQFGAALGDRSCLVQGNRANARKGLQGVSLAEENPQFGAAACADHDRGWRGKAHGAGAGDDQNGDHLNQRIIQRGRRPEPKPQHESQCRGGDHGRHEPSRHSVHQRLNRQFRALRLFDHADDLRQNGVGTGLGDTEGEASRPIDRAAHHMGASALGHRLGFPGEHQFIDEGGAFDHLAVNRHFFAGLDQDDVPHGDLLEGSIHRRSLMQDAGGRRLEADQMFDGRAGAALRPRLQAPAKQDQGHDDGGGFEIDMRGPSREQARREGHERRKGESGAGAERDERVHIGRAAPQSRDSGREKSPARPKQNQRGQNKLRDPARLRADRRHDQPVDGGKHVGPHLDREDGRRQGHGNDKRAPEILRFFVAPVGMGWRRRIRLNHMRRIAGRCRGLGEGLGICDPGRKANRPRFRREIDIGLENAGNFFKGLLDMIDAGGAAHVLNVEPCCFNRRPIARLADRRDDRANIGGSRKDHLGALRREIDRGGSDPRRRGNRLLDPRDAGSACHAFDPKTDVARLLWRGRGGGHWSLFLQGRLREAAFSTAHS